MKKEGKRYKHLTPQSVRAEKPLKSRTFYPLFFDSCSLFSCVLCLLSFICDLGAFLTILFPVATPDDESAAGNAPVRVRSKYLRFQRRICRKHGIAEIPAQERVGYTLYADAAFPLIKKQAVSVIIIGAQFFNQGISSVSLPPRHLREHLHHCFLSLFSPQRQAFRLCGNTRRWKA